MALANKRNSLVWSSRDLSPCSSRRRRNSGRTRGSMGQHTTETKDWEKKTETKTEGRHTEVTVLVNSSVTLLREHRDTERGNTENSQIESLIIHRVYRERREHKMTFKNRQTLTERTGAFKHRIIGEEDKTHLETNLQSTCKQSRNWVTGNTWEQKQSTILTTLNLVSHGPSFSCNLEQLIACNLATQNTEILIAIKTVLVDFKS